MNTHCCNQWMQQSHSSFLLFLSCVLPLEAKVKKNFVKAFMIALSCRVQIKTPLSSCTIKSMIPLSFKAQNHSNTTNCYFQLLFYILMIVLRYNLCAFVVYQDNTNIRKSLREKINFVLLKTLDRRSTCFVILPVFCREPQ